MSLSLVRVMSSLFLTPYRVVVQCFLFTYTQWRWLTRECRRKLHDRWFCIPHVNRGLGHRALI